MMTSDQAGDSTPGASGGTSGRRRNRRAPQSRELVPVDSPDTGDSGSGGFYWLMRKVVVGPSVNRIFDPIYEGTENVPQTGPAILAANHLSFADWVFIPLALSRRVTFVAKSDYFTGGGVKGWAQKRFFTGTGQVPIDRSGGRASEGALRTALKVLKRGHLFGIFPEGTRSHDGRLYKGRTGVARIALDAEVPVIPVGVIGTEKIAPPGKVLSRVVSPTIRFGKPLDFARYQGMSEDRFILRSVTDEIMYTIMELSGQEYVDLYAPSAKAQQAKQAKDDETDEVSPQA